MTWKLQDLIILYAELIVTKAEGNMLPGIFGSSHFNEEPVMVSVIKTNVIIRSISNLHIWMKLHIQDKFVSYPVSIQDNQGLWASRSYPEI